MQITMIGHSTVLIETGGKKILTDPFFGVRGNPAFARVGVPARSRQECSHIDAVLVIP
jgi:L-ascorbate metabolism protein UlaG (beta-lactamase superfamily)